MTKAKNTVKLKKVKSSNLSHIGYNSKKKVLVAFFKNGKTYAYNPVEKETFDKIMDAESKGSSFNKLIVKDKSLHYANIDSINLKKG